MSTLMDDLVAILLVQAGTYRLLVPLLDEEEHVLVRADAPGLAEISVRRQALLVRLTRLEVDRQAALGRLGATFGVDPQTLTISRLLELAPGSAHALEPIRKELGGLLKRLAVRHGRNRALAERSLACLRGLFASIVSVLTSGPTYTETGHSDQPLDQLRLLDRQA